ncbi:hypothetical protein [Dechloromonas sp. CZR5]|uniref:hypothetical protein n=1 Tax=Dechloromonas sp. CZR5 TaxID=2608630 RepID=UPI001CC665EF|nr:hypothetical protein [Dechloromonas sp. CZR5]
MKPYILAALTVLSLAAASPSLAARDAHHHGHSPVSASLQLNAGKKWETDAPLRTAMGEIRQSMASSLHAIHENKMSAKSYDGLAKQVEGAVGQIVASCKLPPAADAQLHIIVADLLAGAEQMAGKVKEVKRVNGAVKVIGALDNYGKYFDDAGFRPIEH